MNKMSKQHYEMMIANTIAEVMGPSVYVKDMDIKTARAILKRLENFLYSSNAPDSKDFSKFYKSWKNTRSIGKGGIPVRWTSRKNGKKSP